MLTPIFYILSILRLATMKYGSADNGNGSDDDDDYDVHDDDDDDDYDGV